MKIKEQARILQLFMPLMEFAEKRKKESCRNCESCTVDLFFGFIILRDLMFWVRSCLVFIFLGYQEKCLGRAPAVVYMLEYAPWG